MILEMVVVMEVMVVVRLDMGLDGFTRERGSMVGLDVMCHSV